VEATDAAERISESVEEERAERREVDKFRTRAALSIAVLAMLLAVASLGGDNATKEALNTNVTVTDTWAFYQARNIRQTSNELAASDLRAQLLLHGDTIGAQGQQEIQSLIDRYLATAARYESDPAPDPRYANGTGKEQLANFATEQEHKRDHALAQDPNFDYSTALFQIAIVVGSVAIVSLSRPILGLSLAVGLVATVLMLNGFFLFFDLPIG
jgi:Domain of unknown function (DUF4337)